MNNEPNKPIPAQELTEKELEGIAGGLKGFTDFSPMEIKSEDFLIGKIRADSQLINDGPN